MLGFCSIGETGLCGGPNIQSFGQNVSVDATGSVAFTRATSSIVSILPTTTMTLLKAVDKPISIASSPAASIRNAVATAMSLSASATVSVLSPRDVVQAVVTSATATVLTLKNVALAVRVRAIGTAMMAALNFPVVSRQVLHDAVNCVMAGTSPIKKIRREYEIHNRQSQNTTVRASGVRKLSVAAMFTTTTNNKGHD